MCNIAYMPTFCAVLTAIITIVFIESTVTVNTDVFEGQNEVLDVIIVVCILIQSCRIPARQQLSILIDVMKLFSCVTYQVVRCHRSRQGRPMYSDFGTVKSTIFSDLYIYRILISHLFKYERNARKTFVVAQWDTKPVSDLWKKQHYVTTDWTL